MQQKTRYHEHAELRGRLEGGGRRAVRRQPARGWQEAQYQKNVVFAGAEVVEEERCLLGS